MNKTKSSVHKLKWIQTTSICFMCVCVYDCVLMVCNCPLYVQYTAAFLLCFKMISATRRSLREMESTIIIYYRNAST